MPGLVGHRWIILSVLCVHDPSYSFAQSVDERVSAAPPTTQDSRCHFYDFDDYEFSSRGRIKTLIYEQTRECGIAENSDRLTSFNKDGKCARRKNAQNGQRASAGHLRDTTDTRLVDTTAQPRYPRSRYDEGL